MVGKLVIGIGLLALVLGSVVAISQEPSKLPSQVQKSVSPFMERKLDCARDIVAGLATENHELISKSAQRLMLLSHEAEWNVFQTQRYAEMSAEFRGAAERLRERAKEQNLDGATLAYFEVTLNCVRCHKYVRREQNQAK